MKSTARLEALELEAYFERGPSACVIVAPDAGFTVLAVSDAYLRATHVRREDLLGRPFLSLFPDNPASPETPGSQTVRASLERVRASRAPESMSLVRYDIRRPGTSDFEERYWSPIHTPMLGSDGEVRHIVHQVEDVTRVVKLARERDASVAELQALKLTLQVQAERERLLGELEAARAEAEAQRERLRRVVEASGTGTWDLELASGQLTADARHRALMGLAPAGPLTVEQAMEAIRPEHREQAQQTVSEAVGGAHGGRYFTTFRVSGPEERWVEGRGQALFDAAGRAVRLLGTSVDVTPRKQAEAALQQAQAQAQQRADFEQQLIGIVSHDLRTPLSSILLGAQGLLRSDTLGDRQTRSVVRIQSAAERAARMIRDLLDFTQARLGGGLPVTRAPMDLHALVRQTVEELRLAHPERDIHVEEAGSGAGAWDADRIAQVLGNLLTNALAYSPPDSAVRVSTCGAPEAVTLAVHNAGAPLPPELLARLFQPMERGARERSSAGRSVGLGLYIVDQVVRAHGGRIEVSSTEEAGTTFTVHLPRAAA